MSDSEILYKSISEIQKLLLNKEDKQILLKQRGNKEYLTTTNKISTTLEKEKR